MNKRVWIIFSAVVILGLVGLVLWNQKRDNSSDSIDYTQFENANATVFTDNNLPPGFNGEPYIVTDNATGNLTSKVVLVEYADFQCPGCAGLAPTMQKIREAYMDRVAFVYRYFPLPYHNNGMASAVATEAAARQGKFWEMLEVIFSNKSNWENSSASDRENVFAEYAKQVGVNLDKWHDDYKNYTTNGIKDKINFQYNLGKVNEVKVTPSVFVNSSFIEGANEALISEALDKALAEINQ